MSTRPRVKLKEPPLLITEDSSAYFELLKQNVAAFEAQNSFERRLVADITSLQMEKERWLRGKTALLNRYFIKAIAGLLPEFLREDDEWRCETEEDALELAGRWFSDEKVRNKVEGLLEQLGLDESLFHAEAYALAGDAVAGLEFLIGTLQARMAATVRMLFDFRAGMRRYGRTVEGVVAREAATTKSLK